MNLDPISGEVKGSVDHTADAVPTAPYVGCCGHIHDHTIHHASDCRCFKVASVPDIEGRDLAGPVSSVRPVSYADADDNYDPPSVDELHLRMQERIMWALEGIDQTLRVISTTLNDDGQSIAASFRALYVEDANG